MRQCKEARFNPEGYRIIRQKISAKLYMDHSLKKDWDKEETLGRFAIFQRRDGDDSLKEENRCYMESRRDWNSHVKQVESIGINGIWGLRLWVGI